MRVEVFDLEGIVGDVAADLGRVGEEGGNVDGFELDAVADADAVVEFAVRLGEAGPKAERLIRLASIEKCFKVRGVVDGVDELARRLKFGVVVDGPSRADLVRSVASCRDPSLCR